MAIQLKDRILTLCTTVGTNDAIVGATKEGYAGWEGITVGNTVYYCITDNTSWEVGYGQYLSRAGTPTIQRNVLSSSNNNEKLDLSGNASIFCTYPSEKAVFLNADDNMYYPTANINANKFIGDGSALTNLPNDNVWKDNGSSIEYKGDGSTTTQVWAENNGKYAKVIQKNDGTAYFKGDGATFFGTESDLPVNIFVGGINQLAVGKDSVYSFQPVTAPEFIGDGAKITNIDAELNNLTPEAPLDGETYARNNKTWVSISDSSGIPDAPVDGLQYGRQDGEWTPTIDAYTKAESNATNDIQDGYIEENNINIASNTTAIGTLSGQVSQNSEDIAELQDSIFFTSAYSADYPSTPNRDPEDGNMYLQNLALFTYSYASATQIFCSKTDESGNVRQFTAIQAGDSIVLNEVDSPNYGRYELVTVEDVSDSYVVMNVIPKKGQGTVITGVKVAFQAFPKPDSGGGSIWTEVDGEAVYDGDINVKGITTTLDLSTELDNKLGVVINSDTGILYEVNRNVFGQDMTVNGVTVGKGGGDSVSNTVVGRGAFTSNTTGQANTSLGYYSLQANVDGKNNTALGYTSLQNNISGGFNTGVGDGTLLELTSGDENTALGVNAGGTTTTGSRNTLIGTGAYASAPDVNDEVTIGGDNVTKTRLKGEVTTNQDMVVNGVTVGTGSVTNNTIFGRDALDNITTGSNNTAVGKLSQQLNTEGIGNTSLGSVSLLNNKVGIDNTAIGYNSLFGATGSENTALGRDAGNLLSSGGNNLILGAGAQASSPTVSNEVTIGNDDVTVTRLNGEVVTTKDITVNGIRVGVGAKGTASNVVVGLNAFGTSSSTSAYNNVAIGQDALSNISSANNSVAVGFDALELNTTGKNNVSIGSGSLGKNVEGKNNTAIGYFAGGSMTSGDNNIVIGQNAQTSADGVSNEVTIGDSNITVTRLRGDVTMNSNLTIPNMQTTTGATPNLHIDVNGTITNVTDAFYLAREVDGLINAKDKVINALSSRLDSLEIKFKALK